MWHINMCGSFRMKLLWTFTDKNKSGLFFFGGGGEMKYGFVKCIPGRWCWCSSTSATAGCAWRRRWHSGERRPMLRKELDGELLWNGECSDLWKYFGPKRFGLKMDDLTQNPAVRGEKNIISLSLVFKKIGKELVMCSWTDFNRVWSFEI
jgi:hypothetical protein